MGDFKGSGVILPAIGKAQRPTIRLKHGPVGSAAGSVFFNVLPRVEVVGSAHRAVSSLDCSTGDHPTQAGRRPEQYGNPMTSNFHAQTDLWKEKMGWVHEAQRLHLMGRECEKDLEARLLRCDGSTADYHELAAELKSLWDDTRTDELNRRKSVASLGDQQRKARAAVMKVKSLLSDLQVGRKNVGGLGPGPGLGGAISKCAWEGETYFVEAKQQFNGELEALAHAERTVSRDLEYCVKQLKRTAAVERSAGAAAAAAAAAAGAESEGAAEEQSSRSIVTMEDVDVRRQRREAKRERALHRKLLMEVQEFDDFVSRTGATGGWDHEDHRLFLRILKENRRDYGSCVAQCLEELILHDKDSIIRHWRWQEEYESLLAKKHAAIAKWRAQKEAAIAERRAAALEAASLRKAREEQRRQEMAERSRREETLVQLRLWKEAKAAAEADKRAREEDAEKLAKLRERRREESRRAYAKALVEEFLAKKKAEEEFCKQLSDRLKPLAEKQVTQQDLDRRRKQDESILQRRKGLIEEQNRKAKLREERMKKLQRKMEGGRVQVERDPHRVLKPTKAVKERLREIRQDKEEREKNPVQGNHLCPAVKVLAVKRIHRFSRAIPSWRQVNSR
ncbi:hypothetical protein CBR_g19846 [Chara braunii]|uniref:Coiled-coil domain-containing protein 112 n=1 Tax=Chara braunii TaxID=69332 RepID=A0A388KYS8_CHABU|nr:hypothetical protein CBR_g19846 [Chara braunii]|eukprot:GBG75210.1 hypothetical protein CBR_g19846 [Chara braunii]